MKMRSWEYTDNLQISNLEKQIFKAPWSIHTLNDAFLSNNFFGFVMEENGVIIGYVGGTAVLNEGEVNLIAVSESYRKMGFGEKLLLRFIEELKSKGVNKVFLEVRRSNAPAQNLYEKCGFTYMGVRKNYYGGEEDALTMCKIIR